MPIPQLRDNSWMVLANIFPDQDGIARRIPYSVRLTDEAGNTEDIPSIAALLSGEMSGDNHEFNVDFSIDMHQIPRISVIDLLNGAITHSQVKDKIILVGAQAIELRDTLSVPAYGTIGGPELHALGIETLLQNRTISHPGLILSGIALLFLSIGAFIFCRILPFSLLLISLIILPLTIEALAIALLRFAPISIPTGQFHSFILLIGAIYLFTELRKRNWKLFAAKVAHQNTRKIFEQVISENFDGIIVANAEGKIIVANEAAKRMLLEKPSAKIIGKKISSVLPDRIASTIDVALGTHNMAGEIDIDPTSFGRGEFSLTRKKTATRIIDYVATPSRLSSEGQIKQQNQSTTDKDGGILCLLIICDTGDKQCEGGIVETGN